MFDEEAGEISLSQLARIRAFKPKLNDLTSLTKHYTLISKLSEENDQELPHYAKIRDNNPIRIQMVCKI